MIFFVCRYTNSHAAREHNYYEALDNIGGQQLQHVPNHRQNWPPHQPATSRPEEQQFIHSSLEYRILQEAQVSTIWKCICFQ